VPDMWLIRFMKESNLIMLIGKENHWDKNLNYGNVTQTLSQCDMNPGGNRATRTLARSLLAVSGVKHVKLACDTICLSVAEDVLPEEVKEIGDKALTIVEETSRYG